jgi:hypothetical protein
MTQVSGIQRLGGVKVPDTAIVVQAIDEARERCAPYLFNHAMRSWLFAARIAQIRRVEHDAEVVAVGTILHDITLNGAFSGPRRFEVEAADIVRHFALDAGMAMDRAALVWDSVALNSTPSIGLYKQPEVMLSTAGICLDVVGLQYDVIPASEVHAVVRSFPRLKMKQRMTQCFCHIAESHPETTHDNFVRDFGDRFVPGYAPISAVDLVAGAPFAE